MDLILAAAPLVCRVLVHSLPPIFVESLMRVAAPLRSHLLTCAELRSTSVHKTLAHGPSKASLQHVMCQSLEHDGVSRFWEGHW